MSGTAGALRVENPRVYFSLGDAPMLRCRATKPPYAGWCRSIQQQVDTLRRPEFLHSQGRWRRTDQWLEVRDLQRSGIAMRAAFLAALTDEAVYRDLALLLLTDYFADETEYWGDHSLHGRIIAQWALTYDFLGVSLGTAREAVRDKLRRAAMSLYDGTRFFLAHHLLHHANNYSTRTLAGVGLCGLAIEEPVLYDTTPAGGASGDSAWTRELPPAGAILNALFMHQHGVVRREPVDPVQPPTELTAPYPFPEGPGYLAYSVDLYLPFYLALRRLYPGLFNPLFDLQGTPADFMRSWHLWQLQLSMPDGQRPPIKDSDGGGPLGPLLSSVYEGDDAKLFYWDTTRAGGGRGGMEIEHLCFYRPPEELPEPGYEPPFCSAWHETWGMAALRAGWGPEDLYLFVGGGKGDSRLRCYQHEHADPAHFLLHAYGKLLVIDGGYGGWGDPASNWHHEMVWGPRNHNILLVRDERTGEDVGPPPPDNLRMAMLARIDAARLYGVDDQTLARLFRQEVREFGADTEVDRCYDIGRLAHCRATTSYQGLRFERDFFLVDRQWALVVDSIVPLAGLGQPQKVIRQYLHGIGYGKAATRPGQRPVFGLATDGTYYTAPDEAAHGWNRGVWRAAGAASTAAQPEAPEGPVALYAHSQAPGSAGPGEAGCLTFTHGDALHASRHGRAIAQRPQRRHTYSVASLSVDFSRDAAPWLVTLLHPCPDIERQPLALETWPYDAAREAAGDVRTAALRGLAVRFRRRTSLEQARRLVADDGTEETGGLYLIEKRSEGKEGQEGKQAIGAPGIEIRGEAAPPRFETDAGLLVARVEGGDARWFALQDGSSLRVCRGAPGHEEAEDLARLSGPATLVLERPDGGPWEGYLAFNDGAVGVLLLPVPRAPGSVELTVPEATWRYEEQVGAVQLTLPEGVETRFTVSW